jgi:uncharacterized Zn finger protein
MNNSQININLEDTTELKCDSCGHNVFQQGVLLRSLSRFITGSNQDSLIPISVFVCMKCGHVNDTFLPQQKPMSDSPSVEDVTDSYNDEEIKPSPKSSFEIIR